MSTPETAAEAAVIAYLISRAATLAVAALAEEQRQAKAAGGQTT